MWELQESEERFRGLIDALGDLVVHRDRDGRIVYANKVFADLVGRTDATSSARRLAELGVEVGVVPDAAFADGECLSSTDVPIRTAERHTLVLLDRTVGARQDRATRSRTARSPATSRRASAPRPR